MSARNRLASLYEEWRLMSESEGDAIRTSAWQRVEHCQNVKADLREKILHAMETTGHGLSSPEEMRHQFRPVLEHLIGLEVRNSELLAIERGKLEVEREDVNRSQRTIRQLQGSYGARVQGGALINCPAGGTR